MHRKTVNVEWVRQKANYFFLHSKDDLKDQRFGVIGILEGILMETNNYKGFRYLIEDDMKTSLAGKSVGMTDNNEERIFPDESRRFYS